MIENNKLPNRKRTRLKEYDYSKPAYYYVTICTQDKKKMFGDIINASMKMNYLGRIVASCWSDLPNHYKNCELDFFVIMPNHVHGIIIINGENKSKIKYSVKNHGLSEIVRGFKSFSARKINEVLINHDQFHWQKSFYDRIIRNEKELFQIRRYIEQNPLKWEIENDLSDNIDM